MDSLDIKGPGVTEGVFNKGPGSKGLNQLLKVDGGQGQNITPGALGEKFHKQVGTAVEDQSVGVGKIGGEGDKLVSDIDTLGPLVKGSEEGLNPILIPNVPKPTTLKFDK